VFIYSGTLCLSPARPRLSASAAARRVAQLGRGAELVPIVSLLAGYYGSNRVYHHTAPISMIYAIAEGLRIIEEEGMEARAERHRRAAAALVAALTPLGFEPLVAEEHRLPSLTTMRLPEAILREGEAQVRRRLLEEHGLEVGGGLGKLAGIVWRIGLMGGRERALRLAAPCADEPRRLLISHRTCRGAHRAKREGREIRPRSRHCDWGASTAAGH
jgi:alanine-glyoxylate transaminase/serine-glyoxylate transaminase/serine-pyruvate transaminase